MTEGGERSGLKVIDGALIAPKTARFGIIASRFNAFIVERLVDGALDALRRHGVDDDRITLVRVPGSWETPLVAMRLAKSKKLDAVIALGAVIRGATGHYEHVAGEAAKGVAQAAMTTGVPVIFGVLTTDTIEQAIERAGTKAGNKGFDAAMAALEMVTLGQALTDAGY
jgi:6,7-dimethyl-8-ribityllumazine synthase